MRVFRKIFAVILGIIILYIIFNQLVLMKYGTDLITYFRYSSEITKEEKEYLKSHGPIKLGSDITAPPISYYDEEAEAYMGLIVDYANYLSLEAETPIDISMYTFYNLVEELRNRNIDACDMFPSEQRGKEFNLSIPIYRLKTVLISSQKKGKHLKADELSGKRVAIPKGDLAEEHINDLLRGAGKKKAKYIYVDDTKDALELLSDKKVDVAIGDEVVLSNYWKEYDVYETKKYNVELLYEKDVVLAVNKENTELLSVLNKSILQMKKNKIVSKVQQKWFGISESIKGENNVISAFITIALILIAVAGSLYIWNYQLKKRVREKTREISNAKKNVSMILNNLNTAFLIISEEGNIIEHNKAFKDLINSDDNVIGGNIFDIPLIKNLFLKYTSEDFSKAADVEFVSLRNNKSYAVKISPYISENEAFRILSIQDITEKLIIERKLHQENKIMAMGQISAGLSHEIRNPLGTIRNGLYLIKMSASEASRNKAINMMENSINRINDLIEHLLRFSKSSSNSYVKEDIFVLVENIITLMSPRLRANNIKCEFWHTGNRVVPINIEAINIILINLIENAVDAFEDDDGNNKIIIEVDTACESISIKVKDNGCGINKEHIEEIFEPFYTTKDMDHGTGLGLYLVYNEVKKLDGDITVESDENEGTCFTISLNFNHGNSKVFR